MNWYVCKEGDPVQISFDLAPEAAIEYMREKAFKIAGVENQEVLDAIQAKLIQALEAGTSYKDFAAGVREMIDSLGYTGDQPYRLDTVFRTNLFSAYAIGQRAQVEQVKDRFPAWQYVAILDNRTRPTHRELNGKVFRYNEGPLPPIDFNCRCIARYIHITQMGGIQVESPKEARAWIDRSSAKNFDTRKAFDEWFNEHEKDMESGIKAAIKMAES